MMLLLMMMMILLMMIQAQTIAAEAAGVLAENAKTFVTEKLTKSKVLNYFGWGKKP